MDPDKWESVDPIDTSTGVMVSNLPLLFAHGAPTSLKNMSVSELEVFVAFMVRCSVSVDLKTAWDQLPRPPWWPNRLPFRIPSTSTPSRTKSFLTRLVERCYAFHGCQYLLQFCSSLHQMEPSVGYRFTDNRDGTTSMYNGSTGKLLVTFRNENREYDKTALKPRNQLSSQKKLLPSSSPSTKIGAMVRPPITDVFLCDKCDDEFSSLKEVQAHEKHCKGNRPLTPKLPSPEPEFPEEEPETEDQVPFLSYLGLRPAEHTGVAPYTSPRKRQSSPVKKVSSQSYVRYESIDVASPLGRYLLSNCRYGGKFHIQPHQLLRYERHIYSSREMDLMSTRERSTNRWIVVWRPRRDEQPWAHLYCFTSHQKRERQITLQTGLDKRSRMLLSKCKAARVKLKRLAKRTIDRATRLGGRSPPCIDLTSGEDYLSPLSHFVVPPALSNDAHSMAPVLIPPQYSYDIALVDPLSLSPGNYYAHPDNGVVTQPLVGGRIPTTQVNAINDVVPINGVPTVGNVVDSCSHPGKDRETESRLNVLADNGVSVSCIYPNSVYDPKSQSSVSDINLPLLENSNNLRRQSKCNLKYRSPPPLYASASSSHLAQVDPLPVPPPDPSLAPLSTSRSPLHGVLEGPSYHEVFVKEDAPLNKSIEVIDLSSDEEEPRHVNSQRGSNFLSVESELTNRSHARSKNGYSHWSSDECSKRGRDQRYSMTNGTTPKSVPPQPFTTSLSCLLNSTAHLTSSESLDGKAKKHNRPKYIFPELFKHSLVSSMPHSHAPSFFHMTESHDGAFHNSEIVPRIALDVEGSFKTPVQIDEDISFNIRVAPPFHKEDYEETLNEDFFDKASDMSSYDINYDIANNNNNNSNTFNHLRSGLIYNFASKVNKGFHYLSSFVKSNIFDNFLATDKSCEDYVSSLQLNKLQTNSQKLLNSETTKRNGIRELEMLKIDECRELKNRGIYDLNCLNNKKQKVTRCYAKKNFPMINLNTRNGSFAPLLQNGRPRKRAKLKNNVSSYDEQDSNLITRKPCFLKPKSVSYELSSSLSSDAQEAYDKYDHKQSENVNDRLQGESMTHQNFSGYKQLNKRKTPVQKKKYQKRPKMLRELSNLAGDECKELKHLGFHPSDILGAGETPIVSNPSEDDASPSPERVRLCLLSSKGKRNLVSHSDSQSNQTLKSLLQGNKKLSKELSRLTLDEWKELRKCGSHPAQITDFFSIRRNARSSYARGRAWEDDDKGSTNSNTKFSLERSSRLRERKENCVEVQSPRNSHRELIQSEKGMCVVNYFLQNLT